MCELDEHIANCERCRKYLESISQVSVQVMPLLVEKRGTERKLAPAGMRERFLARLAAEQGGGGNDKPIRVFTSMDAVAQEQASVKRVVGEKDHLSESPKTSFSPWRPITIGTVSLIIIAGAYYAGTRRAVQPAPPVTEAGSTAPPTSSATTKRAEPDRVSQLEGQKSELESRLAAAIQELATAQSEQQSLSRELATAKEKLAALFEQTADQPTPETQQTSEQVLTLQTDMSRLSQRLAESELKFGIQQQENRELSSKLALTEADLQRERDLKSAKSQMGELAASRNLHIVDVYDADRNGKRQRSFGRVFYIEGQSLVFYAYDLDDPGQFKANVVFHVWGGKAGANGLKEVTHGLGILHKDESEQNRWAMTFDDPKVLSQINSVFVTAEAPSKDYDQPRGKKVLFAYFGSPANHP